MIETISDLLKLLHRWPSSKRLLISHRGESSHLSGVIRQEGDELVIETSHKHKEREPEKPEAKSKSTNSDVVDAIEQCDHILTLCDEVEGERGEEFAADIAEKVQGVRDWIEENDHVTDKQLSALAGWERGVERWIK